MSINMLGKLHESMREFGLRETIDRCGVWIAERVFTGTLQRRKRVSLAAFAEAASSMHFSAHDLVNSFLAAENQHLSLLELGSEYETLCRCILARYETQRMFYPHCYAVEQGSSFLLYALVRWLQPATVLETGVANGHSSFFILNALRANGRGTLHSIDRSPEVGCLLAEEDRERWCLHVLESKGLKTGFLRILDALPPIDLFLHDSDHSYVWQSFELQSAFKKLAPGGLLASDDCDCCNAFLDFCQQSRLHPSILVETRKVFGLIRTQSRKQEADAVREPILARV